MKTQGTGTRWSHLASHGVGRVNLAPVARLRPVSSRARRGQSTWARAELGRLTSSTRVSEGFTRCKRVSLFIKRLYYEGCVHMRPFSGHAHTSSTHNLRDLLQTGDLCIGGPRWTSCYFMYLYSILNSDPTIPILIG